MLAQAEHDPMASAILVTTSPALAQAVLEQLPAQLAAIATWGAPQPDPYPYLKQIGQPVLVVNGDNDIIILTINSFILKQNLPDAHLIIYADANHGSLFQYSDSFVKSVSSFLKDSDA